MAKFLVTIEEKFTYNLEVEAPTKAKAEDAAFNDPRYTSDDWDDNDAVITMIDEAPPEQEREYGLSVRPLQTDVILLATKAVVASFVDHDDAVNYIIMKEGR